MWRRSGLILTVLLVLLTPAWGSDNDEAPDWPPISPFEMALKDDPVLPGAPAVLLYRGIFDNDTKHETLNLYRVKILKEEGKKHADIQIVYAERYFTVSLVRASVVTSDGKATPFNGEIHDTVAVKSRGVKVQTKTFTLPGVQVGSIIEYVYRIKWRHDFPDYIRNPSHYVFDQVITYPTAHWTIHDELSTLQGHFVLKPLKGRTVRSVSINLPAKVQPDHQLDGSVDLKFQGVPGFQSEDYSVPEDELKGRVDLYYILGYMNSPDDFWWGYARRESDWVEEFLSKNKAVERAALQLLGPNDSPEVKLRKLYARAQQIRNLSFERDRTEREEKKENLSENKTVDDILQHGYGWGNEANLLFAALARAGGFPANIVAVASRDKGFFRKSFPNSEQLNAWVVQVQVGGQELYMDPASRFCPYGLLPWEETGTSGVPLTKGGKLYAFTPQPKSSDAITRLRASLVLDQEGNCEGTISAEYVGQEAVELREDNREADEAGRKKSLEDKIKDMLPDGATIELKGSPNWADTGNPLTAEFHIKVPGWASMTGSRFLVPVSIFRFRDRHPFPNAKRTYPVYFEYPYQAHDEVTLKLPAGYSVESLPEKRDDVYPSSRYSTLWSVQNGEVKLVRDLSMDAFYFKLESYPMLRRFFNNVRAGDEEQLVLKASANFQGQ